MKTYSISVTTISPIIKISIVFIFFKVFLGVWQPPFCVWVMWTLWRWRLRLVPLGKNQLSLESGITDVIIRFFTFRFNWITQESISLAYKELVNIGSFSPCNAEIKKRKRERDLVNVCKRERKRERDCLGYSSIQFNSKMFYFDHS